MSENEIKLIRRPCPFCADELATCRSLIAGLENEVNRLSNIIREEGWAIPDGTLRLGLVSAQEEIATLTKERERLRSALIELKHQSHHLISEEMWRIDAALDAAQGEKEG